MLKVITGLAALTAALGLASPTRAQSFDPSIGRHLAETTCAACHPINADPAKPKAAAPSFVDIARMPSTTELSIKVFLRTPHPTMPNFILSPEEIDSVAAYIVGLAKK